jgi:UDP-glucose 4-epimerase
LITGGAGFIGSHLAERLINEGSKVTIIDDLSSGSAENIIPGCEFIQGDLSKGKVFQKLDSNFDKVFHFASHVGQELSFETPVRDLEVNTLATAQLITWAMRNNKPKIVFASSMSVYGDPENPLLPVDENYPVSPLSPYAVGKLSSESLFTIYGNLGLESSSLRFFNIYGPKQDFTNLKQGMVSIYMSYVLKDLPILVRGSLNRFRDFVYVDDVVDACIFASGKGISGVYNISTGEKTTVRELISKILVCFEKDSKNYKIVEQAPTIRDQFGLFGNSNKLQGIGWKPKTPLDEGLRHMRDWAKLRYLNHN